MKNVFLIGPSIKLNGGISSVIKTVLSSKKLEEYYNIKAIGTIGEKRLLTFINSIAKIFSVKGDDIVHFNVASKGSFIRKYILYKLIGKKCKKIFHLHGGEFVQYYRKSNKLIKSCIVDMLNGCDLIINVSDYMNNIMLHEFPELASKSVVLNNGVTLSGFKPDIKKKKSKILYMGKLVEYKGIFDLIEAIYNEQSFLRENNWKAVIAGDGDIGNLKNMLKKRGIEDLVEVTGWVSGKRKENLLQEASIVAIPSHIESFGIIAVEAMANGCSIIATKIDGLCEVVQEKNGYLVEAKDIKGIGEAIEVLVMNRELRSKLYSVNISSAKRFEDEVMFDKLLSIYKGL